MLVRRTVIIYVAGVGVALIIGVCGHTGVGAAKNGGEVIQKYKINETKKPPK